MRVDGGPAAQGLFPAGLEDGFEVVAHPVRVVGVQAAHARYPMAETLLGEDLGDAVPELVLWLCRRPFGVWPGMTRSQQAGNAAPGRARIRRPCGGT